MASTLKAKGFGDDNILGDDDDYLFPRQRLPVALKGSLLTLLFMSRME
jgi:hypothetical protein